MLAKLIHPKTVRFLTDPVLVIGEKIVVNPSESQLKSAGYKPLVPLNEETVGLNVFPIYTEEEDRITVFYPTEEGRDVR